jgi:hypothetical protein
MPLQFGTIEFENAFWTQILRDHLYFFKFTLEASEVTALQSVQILIDRLTELHARSLSVNIVDEALPVVQQVAKLKLDFLSLMTDSQGKLGINMTPTFINHMMNELQEYLTILIGYQATGQIPERNVLEVLQLWDSDAVGHADGIVTDLDDVEAETRETVLDLKDQFRHHYTKTLELIGYTRTGFGDIPAIGKVVSDSEVTMRLFVKFLQEIKQMRLNKTILGRIKPLVVDHMLREEWYFLRKLASYTKEIPSDIGDPIRTTEEMAFLISV